MGQMSTPDIAAERERHNKGASAAAEFLKTMAHAGRLQILCHIAFENKSVGEIEKAIGQSQSYVSGQLLKMRAEGLVEAQRVGRNVQYHISDPRIMPILEALHSLFLPPE